MKKHQKTLLVALPLVAAMSLAGCKNISTSDLASLGMKGLEAATLSDNDVKRSEERRVGKEWRCRWEAYR